MTPNDPSGTGDKPRSRPPYRRRDAIREWTAIPANVTRGWLLFVVLVGTVFMTFSVYVTVQVVRLDNRVTRDRLEATIRDQVASCIAGNDRRDEAKDVALSSVASDRSIWEAIDALFDTGLPEPARSVIFDGLDAREDKIAKTYEHEDCTSSAAPELGSPPASTVTG